MVLRYCKIIVVSSVALLFGLIGLNNLFNYSINFSFIEHVLSMDTLRRTGVDGAQWRAVHSALVYHFVYCFIIAIEVTVALLCLFGAARLYKNRRAPSAQFVKAKSWAVLGLTIGFVLFVTGFITVGGEWFYLWLAPAPWSGALNAATRLIVVDSTALVFLALPD